MPAPWRKLWAKMVECDELAALLPAEPAPEMLWVRIIATADAYGRVPGDPWMLKARTFPKSNYTPEQIMRCAEALGAMLTWYEVGGKRYIQVTNTETYNPPDWSKISRPEFPHPEGWQPPESLVKFLAENGHKASFPTSRYGIPQLTLSDPQRVTSEGNLRGEPQRTSAVAQPGRELRSKTTSTPLAREANPLEEPERPAAGGDGKGQRPDDGKARMEACSPDWASIFERFGDDPVNGSAQQNIRLALAGKCVDSGNRERCGATSPGDMRRKLIAVLQVMDWGWTDPPVILARRAVDTAADWHDRDLRASGPSPPGLPALEDIQPLIAQPKGDRDNGKQQQA